MKYYLYKLSTLKAHLAVMCLSALASFPLFCTVYADLCDAAGALSAAFDLHDTEVRKNAQFIAAEKIVIDKGYTTVFVGIIGIIALIGVFLTGFIALTKCFKYLRNKETADMEMSAPVTPQTRFFGSFFAGLTVFLVPYIIASAAGALIINGTEPPNIYLCPDLRGFIENMMIYGLMICLMFWCQTSLLASICGRLGKLIKLTVLMNFVLPLITVCAGILSYSGGYGLVEGSADEILAMTGQFSPLGLLIEFASLYGFGIRVTGLAPMPHIVFILIWSALFAVGAYILTTHRRHERTGKAYVYPLARSIVSALTVLAVTFLFGCTFVASPSLNGSLVQAKAMAELVLSEIAFYIIGSLGMFTACELADSKGEKHRAKRFTRYFPYVLASAAIVWICTLTGGFGAADFIPSPEELDEVYLDIVMPYTYPNNETDGYDPQEITQLHRQLINERYVPGKLENTYVTINYRTKDGMPYRRKYYLTAEEFEQVFELAKKADVFVHYFGLYDNVEWGEYVQAAKVSDYDEYNNKSTVTIPADKLKAAIRKDCDELTPKDILERTEPVRHLVVRYNSDANSPHIVYIGLSSFMKNTIELLDQYNIHFDF